MLLAALAACDETAAGPPTFDIPEIGVSIPHMSGWVVDSSVRLENLDAGGVVFRLIRSNAVPMSPRIDLILEAKRERPTLLEDFLTQNLREMARLENDGSVRILNVDQRPVSVGPRRGYRVQHEYAMGKDGATPLSITQVSTIFVLDGRGITVTAPGQTELFHPLADSIERIMAGIHVPVPTGKSATAPTPVKPTEVPAVPTSVQPIDLGTVGGK
jgi:hypothetical protein